MRYLIVFCCALLCVFPLSEGQATIIHVPSDSSTIQAGINGAVNGDTVLVAPGTYGEHINFNNKAILVTSEAGPESTIISKVTDNQPMVTFASHESNSSILDGFTIQNGYIPNGYGGGIYCYQSHPTIRNNIIKDNEARFGGGICCYGGSTPKIENNTIVDNRANNYGGGVYVYQSHLTSFINNIIVDSPAGYGIYSYQSSFSIQYCDVWRNSPGDYYGIGGGTGCISANPAFCDPASDDYFLSINSSPCLGTGQGGSDMGALGGGCDYLLITPGDDGGGEPYSQVSVRFYVENIADFPETFDLNVSDQLGWDIVPSYYQVMLGSGQVDSVDFTVSIPDVPIGTSNNICLTGNPQSNPLDTHTDCLAVSCNAYGVTISEISDVGNDQGRQVHVEWLSFPSSDPLVTDFSIFRRRDSLLVAATQNPNPKANISLAYPPGEWEWVGTIPAFGETLYSAVVPTLKDSTIAEGMYWSVFFVRAGTDEPTVYFDSPVDSGYSLDNLSPSPPAGLIASHEPAVTKLTWDKSLASDFDYHTVYRDTLSGFTPNLSNLEGFTIDTILVDSTADLGRSYYYVVSTTDFSGNESDPSNEAMGVRYIAGDANADGVVDPADVVYLINYFFRNDPPPIPLEAGDCNCDGMVDPSDVVYLINYLFKGWPPPNC